MGDNQERLAEFKSEFAANRGISEDESSRMVDSVIRAIAAMAESLSPIIEAVKKLWRSLVRVVERVVDRAEQIEATHDWTIDWDARKNSLVMSNRPRFVVRKIIR